MIRRPPRTRLLASTLALVLALGAAPVREAHAQAASRSQAIEQAVSRAGGRGQVLSVREVSEGGASYFEVKILTDGRVRVYRIRAAR